jgi:O-antigen/teichoic acid export membrane protein
LAESILRRARPLMAARLAGAALTFAVPMVLARVLVPASYGTFKQGWLLSQTLCLVLPLGLTQSLYYFVPREPARADRFVAQTLWITLALGAVAASLLLAARPLVDARFGNPELSRNLPWVAAFTALTLAGSSLDLAWNATGRIGSAALARVGTEAARGLAMIVGARLGGTVAGVFAGITAAAALRAAVTLVALGRRHGLRGDLAALRRQASYALPFGLAFVLIVPQQQYHQYAVAAAVSAAAFAIYSVGTFQLPIVDVLYTPVSELLQIGLAEAEGAGRPPRAGLALFHEAVLQLSFAFVPLIGLLSVAARELVLFLFSPRYAASVPIFRLAVFSVALAALPLDGVMRARAQNRFMLTLSAAKLAGTVALVTGGLATLGPIGALGGWIVAEALARGAMLWRTAQLFEVPVRAVLPARELGRQLAATLFAVPAAWGALHAITGPLLVRLAACGLAFTAAYLGLSWSRGWLPAGWVAVFRTRRDRPAAASSGS